MSISRRLLPYLSLVTIASSCAAGNATGDATSDGDGMADARGSADARPSAIDASPNADGPKLPTVDASPIEADATVVDTTPDAATLPAACAEDRTITCLGVSDSLMSATNLMSGYSCEEEETTGREHIYRFSPLSSGLVTFILDVVDDGVTTPDDFDLYLLSSACEADHCVAHESTLDDEILQFDAIVGTTYYIAIEAAQVGVGTSLDYQLLALCP